MDRLKFPDRRFSFLRALAMACVALCLMGESGTREPAPYLHVPLSRDQLIRNFDIIVFHNEFDGQTDNRLRKWAVPVRLYLDIRSGDRKLIDFAVEQHVEHLAGITQYDIAVVTDLAQANVVVVFDNESALEQIRRDYFPPKFDIKQVMQTNLCIGQYQSNDSYEIVHAVVVIPVDRVMAAGRLEACVVEEITQILGLPNDSDDVNPSVFNDDSAEIELTNQDILLVKLLFDPRLRAGMRRAEVLANVRDILEEMGYRGNKRPSAN